MLDVLTYFLFFTFSYLLTRFHVLPKETSEVVNKIIIYVALPALILVTIPKLSPSELPWQAFLVPWIILITVLTLIFVFRRTLALSRVEASLVVLLGAFGNTSFLGIPFVSALIGSEGLPIAIVYDQMGSFLALSSLGVVLLAMIEGAKPDAKETIKKVIKFPPFISLCIAIAIPGELPSIIIPLLDHLASLLLPLALISVASQFTIVVKKQHVKIVSLTLTLKLLIGPLLALGLCFIFSWRGVLASTLILEAAMGPMISAGILAMASLPNRDQQNAVVAILGWGLIISFASVSMWNYVIKTIF